VRATGATAGLGLDSLFHGNAAFGLGAKSDIADGSLRGFEFRKCAPEHSGFSLCTLVLKYLCCDPALCDFLAPADRHLCRREGAGPYSDRVCGELQVRQPVWGLLHLAAVPGGHHSEWLSMPDNLMMACQYRLQFGSMHWRSANVCTHDASIIRATDASRQQQFKDSPSLKRKDAQLH
jgi:hypothetical protein